ncbi:MAG: ATP synthase subunit C [Brevinema sp.]
MIAVFILGAILCLTALIGLVMHVKRDFGVIPVYAAKSLIGGTAGFFFIALAVVIAHIFGVPSVAFAQEATAVATAPESAYGLGFLAAGMAVGLACIGAGIATGMAASAGIGAVSDNPKMIGQSLLFVSLCEGISIFGLVIAIMVLGRLG